MANWLEGFDDLRNGLWDSTFCKSQAPCIILTLPPNPSPLSSQHWPCWLPSSAHTLIYAML